jgi:hypothetical protein
VCLTLDDGLSRNVDTETNILRYVKSRKSADLKYRDTVSDLELYNRFHAIITVTYLFDSVDLVTRKPF